MILGTDEISRHHENFMIMSWKFAKRSSLSTYGMKLIQNFNAS